MTRFARAKGSKASNERLPEHATPWSVMKHQLQQDSERKENASERAKFESMRKQNYEIFLKERAAEQTEKTWCSFDDGNQSNQKDNIDSNNASESLPTKKSKKKKSQPQQKIQNNDSDLINSDIENDNEIDTWLNEHTDMDTENKFANITSKLDDILKTKKEKSNRNNDLSDNSFTVTNLKTSVGEIDSSQRKKKSKKRKHAEAFVSDENKFISTKSEISNTNLKIEKSDDASSSIIDEPKTELNSKSRTKKNKKREIQKFNDSSTIIDEPKLESNSISRSKKNKKKHDNQKLIDVEQNDSSINVEKCEPMKKKDKTKTLNTLKNIIKGKTEWNKTIGDSKGKISEKKRRKPLNENKTTLIVNGEELEVVNYDGFPILTKDAERLQDLRKNLISKGIPRSEVNRTLKLERRKAEKALSRMKKKLCFHCRKGGHNLSECPELTQKNEMGAPSSGICFKCGSTEHTHFACKVVRTQDYKFAQCFICKEQGHISRQCPDNPRGLYPKGGGCRECGDVTHLKKDCPKIVQMREDTSIKLDVLDSDNIEDVKKVASNQSKNFVKRIKF